MIRASRSGDSSSAKRIPSRVPAVPTGMKTGVSIRARRVVSVAERASPSVAMILKLIGSLSIHDLNRREHGGFRREHRVSSFFLCVFLCFLCGYRLLRFDL